MLRIAVSVINHAFANGLKKRHINQILQAFTDSYVKTVLGYVGNEKANLFELQSKTTTGSLKDFLLEVESQNSVKGQLEKFTQVDENGHRRFVKGTVDKPCNITKLTALTPEKESEIREQFTAAKYGATMMKLGWAIREWDDDFFQVLDVAARVGSGVGSFGVDRYYVLLKGTDRLLRDHTPDGSSVILDVKYQPPGAVSWVLDSEDSAWYKTMFTNDAERVTQAQRSLTSYTDPFTGWILLKDDVGNLQPFAIRQRSPWKDSPNLNKLKRARDFQEFMEQIAISTATSHVRGTVAKSPGDFKNVIEALLGKKKQRTAWGKAVTQFARKYREQVLLDYKCFKHFVEKHVSSSV